MHDLRVKRSSRSPALVVALLVSLSNACERPRAEPGAGGQAQQGATTASVAPGASPASVATAALPATDTAALRTALVPFLQPIDTLVTLGAWLSAHPRAAIDSTNPPGARDEYVCRVASDTFSIAGRRAVRTALFNRPQPPAGEALPTDTTQLANRVCTLRGVWLVTEGADRPTDSAILDLLHGALVPSLGASHTGVAIHGAGTGTWWEPRAWGAPSAGTTLAILPVRRVDLPASPGDEASDKANAAAPLPAVVLVRVAPHSGFDPWSRDNEDIDDDHVGEAVRELDRARVDTALALARWPRLTAEARILLPRTSARAEEEAHTPARDSAIVRLAIAMRDSVARLEPARRAAAYFVADVAMIRNAEMLDDMDTVGWSPRMKRRLEGLGIEYQESPLGAVHVYPRSWLWKAWEADSLGPAGHLAYLTLLEEGWGTQPACRDSGQAYARVLEHGEAALRRGEADPLVHYYMGQAEHDIVALASPHSPVADYVDTKDFVPLVPAARVKALAHLRAALSGMRDTRFRRDAWRTGMALLLGRFTSTRYFCVYD